MKITNSKILIFSPHQDDEILACYNLLKDREINGNDISIVYVTNGDYKDLENIRVKETEQVLNILGYPNKNIIYLGYSDLGMRTEQSQLYRIVSSPSENEIICGKHGNKVNITNGISKYLFHTAFPENYFTKKVFLENINELITLYSPDYIFIPHGKDIHADHRALNLAFKEIIRLNKFSKKMTILQYLIHSQNDMIWPNRIGDTFIKPDLFSDSEWNNRISMPVDSVDNKYNCICCYESQKPFALRKFLLSFAKSEELYWEMNF